MLLPVVPMLWWCLFAPDIVVLAEKRSPDDAWIASLEESVFKSSVATPIRRLEIRRSDAWLASGKTRLLTFNQDDESQDVGLTWQSDTSLEIRLPRSANGFEVKTERHDTVGVLYSVDAGSAPAPGDR